MATALSNPMDRWSWVPACAGTTMRSRITQARQKEPLRPGPKISTNPHRFRRLRGKYSRRPLSARAGRVQGRGRLSGGIPISCAEIFHASLISRHPGRCDGSSCALGPGPRGAQRRQGRLPAHGLSGGNGPPGNDFDDQLAPAELRPGAGPACALGQRRAVGMDRDPARRRPAGRGGDAGDQRQRVAAASARRAGERPDRHPDAHRQCGRAGHEDQPAGRRDARQRLAGEALARSEAAVAAGQRKNQLVSLAAQGPPNFDTSFTEAYGSQELSSIPVEAGQSKDVKLKVRPPSTVGAGRYPVTMRVSAEDATAQTQVELDITGQPRLSLSGREGRMSAEATAGKEASIPVVVTNTGTAPAEDVELSGSGPSGWKISFEPKTIDRLAPEQNREVQALVTPSEKAIAGDYVASLRAASRGENTSGQFRITVATSTVWGAAGVGIIAIALLVLVGAVARFGRR